MSPPKGRAEENFSLAIALIAYSYPSNLSALGR